MLIPETERKNQKKISVDNIIPFESGTTNFLNLEKDTCHWESTSYETSLIFTISLREIFLQSCSITMMENHDESALMQILQEFGTL